MIAFTINGRICTKSLLILKINSKIINNTITTESVKSELDSNFVSKDKIDLSSLKQIKITEEIINKYKKRLSCFTSCTL